MSIRIFNTLTKQKEEFEPLRPGEVKIYVCGPTVYDSAHLGHARAAVVFDVIVRYFRYRGFQTTYVRNITDVDDKIIQRAQREGKEMGEISERYAREYEEDMAALGVMSPDWVPRVTHHIPDIIRLIQILLDRQKAYVVDGDVYFSISQFPGYGKLSRREREMMMAGARIEIDPRKRDPLDFVLWKASKPGEPAWSSPWGKGRPGWHIECSAMSMKYLGETLDIHGGGKDLIFPHHENEIAQSEGATGKPFVRYWVHNGFVNINAEKMSKSAGNILTVRSLLERYHPEVIRHFLLSAHYRSPLDYSEEAMEESERAIERFYTSLQGISSLKGIMFDSLAFDLKRKFVEAMDDDFNTALAIGRVFEMVRELNRIVNEVREEKYRNQLAFSDKAIDLSQILGQVKEIAQVLGIFGRDPEKYLETVKKSRLKKKGDIDTELIERLIAERAEARRARDYNRADAIRAQLREKGIILEDTPEGTIWKVE